MNAKDKDVPFWFAMILAMAVAGVSSITICYGYMSSIGADQARDQAIEAAKTFASSSRVYVLRSHYHWMPSHLVEIRPVGKPFKYDILPDSRGWAVGFVIHFAPGDNQYLAEIETPYTVAETVKLERGNNIGVFEFGNFKKTLGEVTDEENF